MKKRNKIKSRCEYCGERNKYSLENWKGRDKTRCRKCGEFLIKDINLCKEVKQNKMENKNNSTLYEAIRPVRDGNGIKKGKKKWWMIGIIIIVMLCGWGFFANLDNFGSDAPSIFSLHGEMVPKNITLPLSGDPDLCSQVKAVPSWAKEGVVVAGGYQLFKPGMVDTLIEENITFLYSSTCGYCHKQIEDFGDDWQRYIDSGLTKECW